MSRVGRVAAALLLLPALGLLATQRCARADEIVARNPDTCEETVIRCHEVLPETWTEVEYRETARGPTKKVPLNLVVEIRRTSGGAERSNLEAAIQELDRGNLTEARQALRDLAGGGYKVEEGTKKFYAFPKPAGARGRRPAWTHEYAHFHYGRALVLEGLRSQNDALLEEALLVLDDVPVPGAGAETSGGFLGRFKGGNSRFLPDAMLLQAQALGGLKRWDEAAAAYSKLFDDAVGQGLSPRFVYEAKVGPGRLAEAQGDAAKAMQAYEQAPTALETVLSQAPNRCLRLETGRWYNRVRMLVGETMLKKAEAAGSAAAYVTVKQFFEESRPEALEKKFAGRPAEQLEALISGARDPEVQAVAKAGLGQAYLAEKRWDEAILALAAVTVRSYTAREQAAAALYHLAKAADGALAAAPAEAKSVYQAIKDGALSRLKQDYPESPYATK
jgi:hypothetical protein